MSMKNFVYYGNCQALGLMRLLETKYPNCKHTRIENYIWIRDKKEFPIPLLENADVFIYQPIDKRHGIYSTGDTINGNIMSYLKSSCKKIPFPYIYNSALWVLVPPTSADGLVGGYPYRDRYINSKPIKNLKKRGFSLRKVLRMYDRGNIDFEFGIRFQTCLNILKEREKTCDVKVSKFIEENIKKHRLFFTQNHPTPRVHVYVVNQILRLLNPNNAPVIEVSDYPENSFMDIQPGVWPSTDYERKFWKFSYEETHRGPAFYRKHIRRIYLSGDC